MRSERDGLERAITHSAREHREVRDELVERELHAPAAWVRETFGERPDGPWAGESWENAVRQVARYRVDYDITDPRHALGPPPERHEQHHQGERASDAIEHGERRLGRDVATERLASDRQQDWLSV